MRTVWMVAGLVAVALAGCSDGGPPPELCQAPDPCAGAEERASDHYCVKNDVRPRRYAPDTPGPGEDADPWRLGDFWSYDLTFQGRTRPTTLVYYEDQDLDSAGVAQHYMVGTPERESALEHALFSTNPVIGRVHRTLYSPHDSGLHADMFNFPLCAGSRWNTRFFGTELQMEAQETALALPGGRQDPGGFAITGTGAGASIEIRYSPLVKWFTLIDHRGSDQDVRLALTDFGSGRSGAYHFLRGQKDEVIDLALQSEASLTVPRAEGDDGAYDKLGIHIDLERTSGEGRVQVHVRDPTGTSRACVSVEGEDVVADVSGAPTCPAGPLMTEAPWAPGDWNVTIERPLLDESEVAGEVRLVSIYDRGGTV